MSRLSQEEREQWELRVNRLTNRRLEEIEAANPGLMEQVRKEAKQRSLRSLGLTELQVEFDLLKRARQWLDEHEQRVRRAMIARVRDVAPENLGDRVFGIAEMQEVQSALICRQEVHEDEALYESEAGREILRLRSEKYQVIDLIWMVNTRAEMKTLIEGFEEVLKGGTWPAQGESQPAEQPPTG